MRHAGSRAPRHTFSMSNLTGLLLSQGKLDEAKPLMLEVLEARHAGSHAP